MSYTDHFFACSCPDPRAARVGPCTCNHATNPGPELGRAMAIAEAERPLTVYEIVAAAWFMEQRANRLKEEQARLARPFTPQRPAPATCQVLIPEHCGYIELQMHTEWPKPVPYGNARLSRSAAGHADYAATYGARFKAETLDPALTHYARNLLAWPVCNHGGKVEVIHNGGGRNKDGREFSTFGLRCNACRYRLMPGIDRG